MRDVNRAAGRRDGDRVVGIDELLDLGAGEVEDEDAAVAAAARRAATRFDRRWWLRKVVLSLVVGAALYGFALLLRFSVPYPLLVVLVLAVTVLRHGLLEVRDQPLPAEVTGRGLAREDATTAAYATGPSDGLGYAIGRWDDRLIWAERDAGTFAHLIVPRLADIVDERLRQRHGLTRGADPVRARPLLGEQLWAMLHSPPGRVPDPETVASVVTKVEEL
jgi:hypothetical protein